MNDTDDKTTILLVDDDEDFLLQQQMMLQAQGYEVVTAPGVREAWEIIDKSLPDLAIVDLMLDEMDSGFTLCHHLKQRHPSLPIILASAVSSKTDIEIDAATPEERSWVKADVMLIKPLRFEQLKGEIERLLQERKHA